MAVRRRHGGKQADRKERKSCACDQEDALHW
jgi:hypothetical protein